jgi:hypothetical protein
VRFVGIGGSFEDLLQLELFFGALGLGISLYSFAPWLLNSSWILGTDIR